MNFIWEIALKANASGYDKESLFFQQAQDYSPWCEQAFSSLNQEEIDTPLVEINALCRFNTIFEDILHPEMQAMPRFRAYLLDLVLHLLCEIELKQGLTTNEFYSRKLEQEILQGVLGQQEIQHFTLIGRNLRNQLSSLALNQLKTGASLYLFRKAFLMVCPDAILYQLREEPEQLLIYMGRKQTERYDHQLQFIIDTFLPIRYRIRIFWEHHFGVIGVDATMQIDEIEIF